MLRRLFGPKSFEVPRAYRELDNGKFHDLHYVKKYNYGDKIKAYVAGGPCRTRGRNWRNLQHINRKILKGTDQ